MDEFDIDAELAGGTPPGACVDCGHMALGTLDEIEIDPSRALPGDDIEPRDDRAAEPAIAERDGEAFVDLVKSAELPQEIVLQAFEWWKSDTQQFSSDELAARDSQERAATESEMRGLWGQQYEANLQTIRGYLESRIPPHLLEPLLNARDRSGSALMNNGAILQRILGPARAAGPSMRAAPAAAAPARGQPSNSRAQPGDKAEIAAIEKLMRTDRRAYNKVEAHYRTLLERNL